MSTNVPVSQWRRTTGNGELATSDLTLVTLASAQLVTLSGLSLIGLSGSYTPVPASTWALVESVPTSQWRQPDGLSDFSNTSTASIVDTTASGLVDTAGIQIVDTGVVETVIPASSWSENDAL